MPIDPQNPVHLIVIMIFLAPVLIGLRIFLQWWSARYWIRRYRAKAIEAGCRARFESELRYQIGLARDYRHGLDMRDIRGAYEAAREHIALFPDEADERLLPVGPIVEKGA